MTKTVKADRTLINTILSAIALVVRIISIPPVLALFMSVSVFLGVGLPAHDLAILIGFLSVIPALAYPLQPFIPGFKGKGREGQRKLAFVFTGLGYAIGSLCAFLAECHAITREIFLSYLISCLILTLVNKVTPLHASGHAAGITGALIFPLLYAAKALIPFCLIAYLLILASSVGIKRHTLKEFLLGSGVCFIGYGMAVAILHFLTIM